MRLNWARMTAGLMGAGLVTMAVFFMMGGNLSPTRGAIQIDFSMDDENFAGLEVEIDGEVAGELKYFGAMTRSGFEVEEGEHEVRVLHPEYRCEPVLVDVEIGKGVLLLLDYQVVYTGSNTNETVLTLQY
jgi:hypothetical protein